MRNPELINWAVKSISIILVLMCIFRRIDRLEKKVASFNERSEADANTDSPNSIDLIFNLVLWIWVIFLVFYVLLIPVIS